jgi:hypothetical protein
MNWGIYAAGDHGHSVSFTAGADAAHRSHTHALPASMTNAAAAQSHETTHESAQTRAGSAAHPTRDTTLTNLNLLCGTGNSIHYITLDVKVNNVEVPGSPFSGNLGTGLYIGDSIDACDISSLVVIGQKNVITLAISEWGGPGPVRCSLSGQVSASGVISAF